MHSQKRQNYIQHSRLSDRLDAWIKQKYMNNSFISLDCETNGLYGQVYSVAMQVYRKGILVDSICLSCPIEQELDGWLLNNPHLMVVDNSIVCDSYESMMKQAADFYLHHSCRNDEGKVVEAWGSPNHNTTPVLYHCGMIVEGGFFRALREMGLIGLFEAPMAPIEVADYLRMKGENPYSVDEYVDKYGLKKPDGATHNPLYDCEVAAKVYLHIIK